jgi:prevent-host-death family protein
MMMIVPMNETTRGTTVGAYEAKTKFAELIARAEKGESFLVTKNGRPVARITPAEAFDHERARQAVEQLREFRERQGPPVPEEEAQRNWEELKRELAAEEDERDDRWLSSSMPR